MTSANDSKRKWAQGPASPSLQFKYDENTGKAIPISEATPLPISNTPTAISMADATLHIARGLVPGIRSINKFGRNIEIDQNITADVWDGGQATGGVSLIWVAPLAARTHTIASTSASDTNGGVGARTVKIFGLISWDAKEVTELVTMDTASPPVTSNAYVIIYRMLVMTKGATSSNVGIITATATTDGTVTARINAGVGQTRMAIFGVPSIQTAYLCGMYASANKAGGSTALADVSLLSNPEPGVEDTNFLTKHTFGLMTSGTSSYMHHFCYPKRIEGPAIFKMQVVSGTNDMDVSAGFDMVLIDN